MKVLSSICMLSLAVAASVGMSSFTTKEVSKPLFNEYNAQHISTISVGSTYEWTWSVTNPNPGNGDNGTLQNLSHWSLAISDLVSVQDIVAVQYSTDGINWHNLPVSMAIDKSQECYTGTVLKFDYGTSGGTPTYYKLVVDQYFTTGATIANFKSGKVTGCYNGSVTGIGTPSEDPTPR
jgi:hypothetical protein